MLYNVRTGSQIGQALDAHQGTIAGVAFSPDGRTLVTAGQDGSLVLWDLRTHTEVGQRLGGDGTTSSSVAFSPDGGTLAAGYEDGIVRLWQGIGIRSSLASTRAQVCDLVHGNLTPSEWGKLVPGVPYRTTCG